ncbi:MAG TPA: Bax inhibitor-1/YccA family protein [Aggregatilineaceae bacterium]|nr:Bax inhibitor-1/YccA family protein [Aggregatilineaceae bacterium]
MTNFLGAQPYDHVGAQSEIRPLIRGVYAWMTVGLLVTAFVAYLVSSSPTLLALALNPAVVIVAIIVELVLVFVLSGAINRLSAGMAMLMFLVYAALNGFTLSLIFITYNIGTLTLAFFTTAATFAAMTLIAFTTDIDLSRYSTYFMMGLIGLMIALVVNIFLQSSGLDFILSIVGVLLFSALTAYDTQRIQQLAAGSDDNTLTQMSIRGALALYLDVINLFFSFLRIFDRRQR